MRIHMHAQAKSLLAAADSHLVNARAQFDKAVALYNAQYYGRITGGRLAIRRAGTGVNPMPSLHTANAHIAKARSVIRALRFLNLQPQADTLVARSRNLHTRSRSLRSRA